VLKTLKGKIIVPIVGFLVVLVLFIGIFVHRSTTELADYLSDERIRTASQAARAHLESLEAHNAVVNRLVAANQEVVGFVRSWNAGMDRAGSRLGLLQHLNARRGYYGINDFVVSDGEGNIILRTHELDRYGDSGLIAPPIAAALRQGVTSISYSSTAHMPMGLSSAAPIWDDGVIIGTITVMVRMDTNEFVDNFAAVFNAEVTIFRGTESIASTLVHPASGMRAVGTHVAPHVAEIVLENRQSLLLDLMIFGVMPHTAYYLPLPGWDGSPVGMFFIGFSTAYQLNATAALGRSLVIIGAIALAVTIGGMLLHLMRVLKPLDLLRRNLDDIANGDADLTRRLSTKGRDEISDASRHFNKIMNEIRKMIIAIKKQAAELSSIGNDLSSNMTETSSAIDQITANIQSVKGRVMNQSASVSQTHSTMEQVVVNINKLNGQVEKQGSTISHASAAIEEMVANTRSVTDTVIKNDKNVKALMEASEVGRNGLQGVAEDIQEIARESEGLLEINSVMENIASQTNLLSMNAAIEAAHAGDAGKGFAVVADEIRKLAESSSEQSKIIGTVLKKIKESIDKITTSTENVLNRFEAIDSSVKTVAEQEANIRYAMEEQGAGSKQILDGVSTVNEITRQVNVGSKEMLEGAKEVIQESRNLEKVTQEITNGINEMASGTSQVNKAVAAVNDLTGRNRENISSLVKAVSQFKV